VSGAIYPVGATTVTCTITDAQHRTSNCTFPVTVVVPRPPVLSVTTFVAFGDSITSGEDGMFTSVQSQSQPGRVRPTFLVENPYPEVLAQQLRSRYRTQSPTVANAGQPGESVTGADTLSRFARVVPAGRYAVVLIMEGSNDVNSAVGNPTIPAKAIDGLRQMVITAGRSGIRPYLATIPPIRDGSRGGGQALVPGFNESVRALARQQGVPLVDVYVALNADVNTYIGFDGLHPTPQGYVKIADTFFSVIRQTLETPPAGGSITPLGLGEWPPRTGSFATPVGAGPGSRAAVRIPR
jgi:lysophospholipase L1-like esterase